MVRYRRNLIEGGSFFFTVALSDRASSHLTTYIADLRAAFRSTRMERPFATDAIVILPEHLHAIFTLPADDADFPSRWRIIKARFTASLRAKSLTFPTRDGAGYRPWQRRFWEHTIRNDADRAHHVNYIHYNPVRHGLVRQQVGRISVAPSANASGRPRRPSTAHTSLSASLPASIASIVPIQPAG